MKNLEQKIEELRVLSEGKTMLGPGLSNPDVVIESFRNAIENENRKNELADNELFIKMTEWLENQIDGNELSLITDRGMTDHGRALKFERIDWCKGLLKIIAPDKDFDKKMEARIDNYLNRFK